jgi:Sporulation and spore germination
VARKWKIAIGILAIAVVIGVINFRSLWQRIRRLSQSQNVEEQARREVLAPPITTPSDVTATARIFWAAGPDKVAPVEMQLPLSADPAQRSKQVLRALIASAPTAEERTLPADAELLGFYVLADGTAVADFSDELVSEIPSGISSEQLIVDSITQTLENNVPSLKRLKILIHGQEVETLAGHVDLTGFFDLNPPVPQQASTDAASPAANGTSSSGNPTVLPDAGLAGSPKQLVVPSGAKP